MCGPCNQGCPHFNGIAPLMLKPILAVRVKCKSNMCKCKPINEAPIGGCFIHSVPGRFMQICEKKERRASKEWFVMVYDCFLSQSELTAACVRPSVLPATRGRCPWPRCWQNRCSKTWLTVVINSRVKRPIILEYELRQPQDINTQEYSNILKNSNQWGEMFQDRYGLEFGNNLVIGAKLRLPSQKVPYDTLPPRHCVVQLWAGVCYKAAPSKVRVCVL